MRINHIINPVRMGPDSDLYIAQPITFASMQVAAQNARDNGHDVRLMSAQYPEDREIIPEFISPTQDLIRSVMDVGSFSYKRKLPLIADILSKLEEGPEADIYIYTNVDIGLQPSFYNFVADKFASGFDALVINRRTISDHFKGPEQLGEMYLDIGKKHPGKDCFVFTPRLLSKAHFGRVCIGQVPIGAVFYANQLAYSHRSAVLEDEYQTFHIGDDQVWRAKKNNEYALFNLVEARKVLIAIRNDLTGNSLVMSLIRKSLSRVLTRLRGRSRISEIDQQLMLVHGLKREFDNAG